MYKAMPTGRGDYAVVYKSENLPAVTHATGMNRMDAEFLAMQMQSDMKTAIARAGLIACSTSC